jgi:hypothetical protein
VLFQKSNDIIEKGAKDYQKQLVKVDEEIEKAQEGALEEADSWRERIPEINKGIQEWFELETKAWDMIKKAV